MAGELCIDSVLEKSDSFGDMKKVSFPIIVPHFVSLPNCKNTVLVGYNGKGQQKT